MIPHEKSEAVLRGVSEAFGTTVIEDIRRMTGGLSSDLILRIVVKDTPYLLRIMTRMDERNDPARLFTAMKVAAEAGIAPRVWHADVDSGISITDFVEAVPLSVAEGLVRISGTLRKLHALTAFPKTFNFVTMHNFFIWRFRVANLLQGDEVEEVYRQYAKVCAVYPRVDEDMVSCHDDLKPENILFDGQRVWLVDWQAAFVNDRYFDLGIVANFLVDSHAEECAFLREYFGQPADEYQRARFFLMRQAMHLMYAAVFLLLGAAGKPVDRGKAMDFKGFHQRIWSGGVNLADDGEKVGYGLVHWDQLLRNLRLPRFEEALKIVAEWHPEGARLFPAVQ